MNIHGSLRSHFISWLLLLSIYMHFMNALAINFCPSNDSTCVGCLEPFYYYYFYLAARFQIRLNYKIAHVFPPWLNCSYLLFLENYKPVVIPRVTNTVIFFFIVPGILHIHTGKSLTLVPKLNQVALVPKQTVSKNKAKPSRLCSLYSFEQVIFFWESNNARHKCPKKSSSLFFLVFILYTVPFFKIVFCPGGHIRGSNGVHWRSKLWISPTLFR